MAVVVEQRIAIPGQQRGPGIGGWDGAGLVVGRAAALVRLLEEQQVAELFDVVAIAQPVVAKDVAVVPELLDEGGGVHAAMPRRAFFAAIGSIPDIGILAIQRVDEPTHRPLLLGRQVRERLHFRDLSDAVAK